MTEFKTVLVNSSLKRGDQYPYDAPDEYETPPPAKDWAHRAARGVIADLCDRRDIKHSFGGVDEDVRVDLVETLADIIRGAAPTPPTAGWMPIETAPKDGTTVWLYVNCQGWDVIGSGRWVETFGITGWIAQGITDPPGNLGLANPSHWKLPTYPKAVG